MSFHAGLEGQRRQYAGLQDLRIQADAPSISMAADPLDVSTPGS